MRLVAIGDLSLNGYYHNRLARNSFDPLKEITSWNSTDLIVGNLESPITATPRVAPSKCTLRGSTEAYQLFAKHNMQVFSVANNHMMDFGPAGLTDTLKYLDTFDVKHVGGGESLYAANQPLIMEQAGQRVAFLAFCDVDQKSPLYAGETTTGVAPWLGEHSLDAIRLAKTHVDWLVVFMHWGVEMSRLPTEEQRITGRKVIEAGADAILGSHPHVLQPIEHYGGRPIAYSLGNFLFSPMYWRGTNADGEPFCSKLRLHPLSRRTGWLEIDFENSHSVTWHFHPARLGHSLNIYPGWPSSWKKEWDTLCNLMESENYGPHSQEETARGYERTFQRWNGKSLWRRMEMRLFHHGLIQRGRDTQ
ncbi:CapA family protein [Aeoliella mucimassa]|uniref:Capsule biosynthesis protein CapA n=1 Tax=Aeoliella mucimassa TaxID=2527972 RepID=A0A518ALT8_9BACT|nr:CapA family protein [Aeoliella mucimassa]QDU55681.1 Capsule biosynthesis protein CapA [Aeoliella mucimassa]